MTPLEVITALALPPATRVNRRVPKKVLVDKGAPTASDKRQINEGVEELLWIAMLKPAAVGVPEFRDDAREYLEIAVLSLSLRPAARASRLVELVHRAIPYPVVLLTSQAAALSLSLAHKRRAQNDATRTVLEEDPVAVELQDEAFASEIARPFLDSVALDRLPGTSLHALYQGWMDALGALQIAAITGHYCPAQGAEHAAIRREALRECFRLENEIATLRATASREKQIARQVELNLEIKRLNTARDAARARL
ncbi:MAG TPA: DUF4391 domain-containing protein [Myxococcales bacterium]|nr:DUF4391 domain-containing protein [Myxococcales bacterium]